MFSQPILCMAVAIYFEARSESFYGQLMIANTIENRVESKHYPNNYCDVITQKGQFSFFNNISLKRPLKIKNHHAFITALAAAEYYNTHKPKYYSGCHYATPNVVNEWTMSYDMVYATMGHFFYEGGC